MQQQEGAQEGPDVQELSRLEELLRRPDFLLEPQCFSVLCAYVKAGGTPQSIIENLSDGYMGYAHMASLMCNWMEALEHDLEGTELSKKDAPAGAAASGPAAGQANGQAGKGEGGSKGRQELSEFGFLKEFVRARFDPDKLSSVFMKCARGKPPAWLDQLTATPQGRALIYQLSASHRNCMVLNFAIQKILLQGHEDEVASVGSSLASYFTVFHRLLATRLRAVLGACTRDATSQQQGRNPRLEQEDAPAVAALRQLSRELIDSCAHAGHTYLHAQQLLLAAAEECPQGGAVCLRLSQDLQAATTAQYPAAWGTMRMLLPLGASPSLIEAAALVSKLLARAPSFPGQDVVRLANLYQNERRQSWGEEATAPAPAIEGEESDSDQRLPLHPIRHPALIRLLLAGVFTPGKSPNPEVRDAAIQLLALATAGGPPAPVSASHTEHTQTQRHTEQGEGLQGSHVNSHKRGREGGGEEGHAGKVARLGEGGIASVDVGASIDALFDDGEEEGDIEGVQNGGANGQHAQEHDLQQHRCHQQYQCASEEERLQQTQSALHCVLSVGAKATARGICKEDVASVQQIVSMPIAAAALLHHIRTLMGVREYYGEAGAPAASDYLHLALLVARAQPQLVQEVVELLQCALEAMGSQRAELAHACLAALVHIMSDCHAVEQVMGAVDVWAKEADPSLVRYLAIQMLLCLAPPYSPPFALWLLRHTVKSCLRRGRDMHQGTRNAQLLQEFASNCLAMAEDPSTSSQFQLEAKELQLLHELVR